MFHIEWRGSDQHFAVLTEQGTIVTTSRHLSRLEHWLDHAPVTADAYQYTREIMAAIHRQRVVDAVLLLRCMRMEDREYRNNRNRKAK